MEQKLTTSQKELYDYQKATASKVKSLATLCNGLSNDAGWWKGEEQPDLKSVCLKLLLIHSEISEAMEGLRKNSNDDHLPHRKMFEVELADAIIRIFDLAGQLDLDLGGAMVEKLIYNQNRKDHKKEARESDNGKKF